ncbi:MAG: mechanosensitive ion channel family protein [Oscillospiraceae bacterium]|nr:mechanosensitive ion channel family protein [Oscillospiraceae bacterium]
MDNIMSYFKSIRLNRIFPTIIVLAIGILIARLLLKIFDRALKNSKLNKTMFSFVKALMRILLYSIVVLIAASCLGIDVTSLIAVLSVVSLAVSLSVQNALTNVVGSISLLATQPFLVGDFVQIGSESGTVQEVSMSYTRLLTTDGRTVYIPNSDAASARICNYSEAGKRRIELSFTASYSNDIEAVKAALLRAADQPEALNDPAPMVFLNAYKDSAVEYCLYVWVNTTDFFQTKHRINETVKKEFDRSGISIPFPQLDVHVQK